MYDCVRPNNKVIGALRWLKDNYSPFYEDFDNWVQDSLANNCDLLLGLDTDDTHTEESMDTSTIVSQTCSNDNAKQYNL